jgi:hypothetical protein
VLVLWLVGWEIVAAAGGDRSWFGIPLGSWSVALSPWQAVQAAARPVFAGAFESQPFADPVYLFLVAAVVLSTLLNAAAIARVRVWNTVQEVRLRTSERPGQVARSGEDLAIHPAVAVHGAGGKVRPVWDNPILWREIRTWAYGKRILIIRLAYWAVFAACAVAVVASAGAGDSVAPGAVPAVAKPLVTLLVVGLILLNALAVTSLTSERDSRALDLLLVTDLSPKEIVFGKLGGAFYNAKEMIALPIALCAYLWIADHMTTENFVFLVGGLAVMNAFAAMVGLHAGITYANSRTAIATSIGTLLFLFLGVATCMRIMLAFSDSFESQFTAFAGFIAGGSLAMYVALGWRNPSPALGWASALTPFLTFVVITSFLLGNYGAVFLLTVFAYGFATGAMLVPAIYVFDVATGRTTAREE